MNIPQISKENVKKILDYSPFAKPKTANMLQASPGGVRDVFVIDEVREFLAQLDVTGFNLVFDYQQWINEMQSDINARSVGDFLTDVHYLQNADLDTLRKLITTHIRTDRFVRGHLTSLFNSGYMTLFLSRLSELYRQM